MMEAWTAQSFTSKDGVKFTTLSLLLIAWAQEHYTSSSKHNLLQVIALSFIQPTNLFGISWYHFGISLQNKEIMSHYDTFVISLVLSQSHSLIDN